MLKHEIIEVEQSESPTITLRLPKASYAGGTQKDFKVRSLRAIIGNLVELYNDYPNDADILFYASNWLISLSVKLRESIRKVIPGE